MIPSPRCLLPPCLPSQAASPHPCRPDAALTGIEGNLNLRTPGQLRLRTDIQSSDSLGADGCGLAGRTPGSPGAASGCAPGSPIADHLTASPGCITRLACCCPSHGLYGVSSVMSGDGRQSTSPPPRARTPPPLMGAPFWLGARRNTTRHPAVSIVHHWEKPTASRMTLSEKRLPLSDSSLQ